MIDKYANEHWGTYFIGQYYFRIHTDKSKEEAGILETQYDLPLNQQRQLQRENLPAIIHEYVHYLHELSTVVGNVGLGMDITLRSLFSNWMDFGPDIAESFGTSSPDYIQKFGKARITKDVLNGNGPDVINGRVKQIDFINYTSQPIYIPYGDSFVEDSIDTPVIGFTYQKGAKLKTDSLKFGKFFLYEGLAYELDRIIEQKARQGLTIKDKCLGSEYTVLRQLAHFIFPGVEKQTYLSVGVLALQHLDCGRTFIQMLESIHDQAKKGINQTEALTWLKREVSSLLASKRQDFMDGQEEFHQVFFRRKELYRAMGYLVDKMKQLYDERITNPCFEVDLLLGGQVDELLSTAQVCDYIYVFTNQEEYMRDFFGTSLAQEDSYALKILLAHDHFFQAHWNQSTKQVEASDSHKCPFFTCCHLPLRVSHASICETKPWRIFEVSAQTDRQYCWYGQGVMESKGLTVPVDVDL